MNSELSSEEIPPARMWHHGERLEEWFASVSEQRIARMKGQDVEDVPEAGDGGRDGEDEFVIEDPEVRALRG